MRGFNTRLFDQVFDGSTTIYSPTQYSEFLGSLDALSFQVTAGEVVLNPLLGPAKITVAIEHSADGIYWAQKNATAEILGVTISTGSVLCAADPQPRTPSLRFVRLRVDMASKKAEIRLDVTGRDRARPPTPISTTFWEWFPDLEPETLADVAMLVEHLPKITEGAWSELRELASDTRRLPMNERLDHMLAKAGKGTKKELHPVATALARIAPRAAQGVFDRLVLDGRRQVAETMDADTTRTHEKRNWKVFQGSPADRPGADTGSESWKDAKPEPEVFIDLTRHHGDHAHHGHHHHEHDHHHEHHHHHRKRHGHRHEVDRLLRRLTRRHVSNLLEVILLACRSHEPSPEAHERSDAAGSCGRSKDYACTAKDSGHCASAGKDAEQCGCGGEGGCKGEKPEGVGSKCGKGRESLVEATA